MPGESATRAEIRAAIGAPTSAHSPDDLVRALRDAGTMVW